jgi:deoxyxylulose-5-phosphate synthase
MLLSTAQQILKQWHSSGTIAISTLNTSPREIVVCDTKFSVLAPPRCWDVSTAEQLSQNTAIGLARTLTACTNAIYSVTIGLIYTHVVEHLFLYLLT